MRSVQIGIPVARSRQRRPSASAVRTMAAAGMGTGAAVISAPERSVKSTRPLASSTPARPPPATIARSSSRTTGSAPATPVSTLQRTAPVRGWRLVTRPSSERTRRRPSVAARVPGRSLAFHSTAPVFSSSARTSPSRVATKMRWPPLASGGTTKSPSSVFQAGAGGKLAGRGVGATAQQESRAAVRARARGKAQALYNEVVPRRDGALRRTRGGRV